MTIVRTPRFAGVDHPVVGEILKANSLSSNSLNLLGKSACILALSPTGDDNNWLFNVAHLDAIAPELSEGLLSGEAYASSCRPEMRQLIVSETAHYFQNIAEVTTIDLHQRPSLHSSNLDRAYVDMDPENMGAIADFRSGSYYPLCVFDKAYRPSGGLLGQQILAIPGGNETMRMIDNILKDMPRALFGLIQKQFNEAEYLPVHTPLDFLPLNDSGMATLTNRYGYNISWLKRLTLCGGFLGLKPYAATRDINDQLFSRRYTDYALSQLPPGGATIDNLVQVALQPNIQAVAEREVDRYIGAIADRAIMQVGSWWLPKDDLSVTGRTSARTPSKSYLADYRPLFHIPGRASGIIDQQTLHIPGDETILLRLQERYEDQPLKKLILDTLNTIPAIKNHQLVGRYSIDRVIIG